MHWVFEGSLSPSLETFLAPLLCSQLLLGPGVGKSVEVAAQVGAGRVTCSPSWSPHSCVQGGRQQRPSGFV